MIENTQQLFEKIDEVLVKFAENPTCQPYVEIDDNELFKLKVNKTLSEDESEEEITIKIVFRTLNTEV